MDEWLRVAKGIPVGSSRRIRHGNEVRLNMVVRNEPDRWSAYCHRCGTGWSHRKSHVVYSQPPTARPSKLSMPRDLQEPPQEALGARLWAFGLTDRVMTLAGFRTAYSPSEARLYLIHYSGAWHSRSVLPKGEPKWTHRDTFTPLFKTPDVVVLTEDLISAIKVHTTTGLSVLCTHGTHLSKEALPVVSKFHHVLVMFDGDKAGEEGSRKVQRTLKPFCHVENIRVPAGKDPKDLDKTFIQLTVRKYHAPPDL